MFGKILKFLILGTVITWVSMALAVEIYQTQDDQNYYWMFWKSNIERFSPANSGRCLAYSIRQDTTGNGTALEFRNADSSWTQLTPEWDTYRIYFYDATPQAVLLVDSFFVATPEIPPGALSPDSVYSMVLDTLLIPDAQWEVYIQDHQSAEAGYADSARTADGNWDFDAIYTATGHLDGEHIGDDTIDDDSIDFGIGGAVGATDLPEFGTMDKTTGYMLVADGVSYDGVYIGGDISAASNGVLTIVGDAVEESMLKCVDLGGDEEILTRETSTGDFEWELPDELFAAGTGLEWAGDHTTLNATGSGGGLPVADFGDSLVNYDGDGIKITDLADIDVLMDVAGGIETVDDSLNVKLDGASLSLSSSGLKVTDELTLEELEDYVGAMVSGNVERGIAVTYDDNDAGRGKLDFNVDSLITREMLIWAPDGINDEIEFLKIDALKYPNGVTLIQLSISLPADAAYSMVFEEWAGDPPVAQNDVETVTTTGTDAYMEVAEADIDDKNLDADDMLYLHVPATDVDWIKVMAIFVKD